MDAIGTLNFNLKRGDWRQQLTDLRKKYKWTVGAKAKGGVMNRRR